MERVSFPLSVFGEGEGGACESLPGRRPHPTLPEDGEGKRVIRTKYRGDETTNF